ncbi:MAG: glycosyltransferase, partial [Pseudonocardiaceae bacterium]
MTGRTIGQVLEALVVRMAPEGSGRATLLRRVRTVAAILRTDGLGAAIRRYRSHRAWRSRGGVQPLTPEDRRYHVWLERHDPSGERLEEMRQRNRRWAYRPLISVVVPVFDPDRAWLDAMVSSVRSQTYDNWELCLADDCSPSPHVRPALTGWAAADPRIKVAFREQNGNIGAASNTALRLATGE